MTNPVDLLYLINGHIARGINAEGSRHAQWHVVVGRKAICNTIAVRWDMKDNQPTHTHRLCGNCKAQIKRLIELHDRQELGLTRRSGLMQPRKRQDDET